MDYIKEHCEEEFDEIQSSFKKEFNNKLEDLTFLDDHDDWVYFNLPSHDEIIILDISTVSWSKIQKVILDKNTTIVDEDTPELLPNSSNEISYELYPSGDVYLPLKCLGYDDLEKENDNYDCDQDVKFKNYDEFLEKPFESAAYFRNHMYSVNIGHGQDSIIYIVSKQTDNDEQEIISCFVDKPTTYQLGDGSTNFYTNDDNIIIENEGDVSSIVVIKFEKALVKACK
jgi:hypothetical protein